MACLQYLDLQFNKKTACTCERRAFLELQTGLYKDIGNNNKFLVLGNSSYERRWRK